ncbi:hypothetical protein ROZALSC1DRAFT_26754 [Rozella allomycis CSF55]|uniref:60S acidic ribosomal protein P1-alpha 1 n=1 Tax=Rozella allomycis (strain CSF55) TaxID=988480 RepID=A0A075ANS7_ROZAC|nr:60S acidic ribosomal protein P1-alpha 1 [Rozella allomycis CSF55]RKP21854.1 hypothetical protein ROZALSC1DRAFT_26754 [Rozella allomycis CSF55]|eukprot:EPZ31580.1 60S acidic ribosomal protein P1-alpha 1 [Rozella allomycis CSF55]
MSTELAIAYASLILFDDSIEITSDNLLKLTSAAGVEVEPIWASLFAKALEGRDIKDLIFNVGSGSGAAPVAAASGAAPAAAKEEVKEEEKEETEEEMGFGLFD